MARPCKNVAVQSKHLTKEEMEKRLEVEEKLKGGNHNLKPPKYLNTSQKKIYKYIVEQLEASGILSNLDNYILCTCVIAIDRLQEIEESINKDTSLLADRALLSAKDKYTKDLYRCTNELCLSPQARAKLGSINAQADMDKQDPLLAILKGGEDT